MNPRQRRGVLFILTAALMAVVVFVAVTVYVGNVSSQVGSLVTVYRASSDLPAYSALTEETIRTDEVPRRWLSDSAVLQREELLGRRVAVNLDEGTMLTSDMLVPPSDLDADEREIAINVDSVTGVADRVQPGDYVDIYAVFADVPGLPKQVRVLVRSVRVVSVRGTQVQVDQDSVTGQSTVIPVTLALTPNDALAVTYAAAFAQEVRLVGLPAGTPEDRTGEQGDFDAGDLGGEAIPEGGN
ncbi:Flp pilus assembly protein CpaB [Xylanimonas oleitrophica]|uniref:Flp pilus assembly protein CpaB n=1 Tax=Xylanimonas oleitrophica TaxID=2607479 RepID=A0A2W5Y2K7_9MICO|nr:Flp pilus assembly protein CpaB [Xylanimonas oleitrophica]PZR51854.1 Flp pilus assembly protein CpaB [Xylanimonas oleitrophica]